MERPRVFLSYSSNDRSIVERVASILKKRDVDVWFDEWKLRVGDSLISEIEKGIQRADFIVLFISSHSLSSKWVREEYEASKVRAIESEGRVRILPAILDGSEVPGFLASRVYADFRESFSYGCARIIGSIFPERHNLVEESVIQIKRGIDKVGRAPRPLAAADSMDRLQQIKSNRARGFEASCKSLVFSGHPRDTLLKCNRDLVQLMLYEEVLSHLQERDEVSLSELLDCIYSSYISNIFSYGVYGTDFVSDDLRRIFDVLVPDELE